MCALNPLYLLPAAAAAVTVTLAWADAKLKTRKPDIQAPSNQFTTTVLSQCPTLHQDYRCLPFFTNGHVETILIAKLRSKPNLVYKREVLLTKDGGCVSIDWEHFDLDQHVGSQLGSTCMLAIPWQLYSVCRILCVQAMPSCGSTHMYIMAMNRTHIVCMPVQVLPEDAPVLILFPGLTGGSCDSYVQHAVQQARACGIRAAVFNSRGTADSPVLTPRFYSASFTEDARYSPSCVAADM